jgi:hypothetical protein
VRSFPVSLPRGSPHLFVFICVHSWPSFFFRFEDAGRTLSPDKADLSDPSFLAEASTDAASSSPTAAQQTPDVAFWLVQGQVT